VSTNEELGNQHGYQCPECGEGDGLHLQVMLWVSLLPEGTETDAGDTEWGDEDRARCDCGWKGQVKDLNELDADEETEELAG
jgi:hypothetical protein